MSRLPPTLAAPALALLALTAWPLLSGSETLVFRDVLTSHLPMKCAQAESLRAGAIASIDPARAGGQPLLGNPNALPLYPTNGLYLITEPLHALNLHVALHWLLAVWSAAWLGRAWGLRRAAAWCTGLVYATGGYVLSLLNLYNLVAVAAWAPALVAAVLDSATIVDSRRRAAARWVAVAVLWALLLAAGDPMSALVALALAVGALSVRPPAARPYIEQADTAQASAALRVPGRPRIAGRLAAALAAGTLLVAPMWIEMLRILPSSERAGRTSDAEAILTQSFEPRALIDWIVPLFFGEPGFAFWGQPWLGGHEPLLVSLAPGLVGLAMGVVGLRSRRPAARWALAAVAAGAFAALGRWNPLVVGLAELPGAALLRYPVKAWLAVAVGGALLAGLGFERLSTRSGRRSAAAILGLAGALSATVWGLLLMLPTGLEQGLRGLSPTFSDVFFAQERLRWMTQSFFATLTAGGALLALALVGRRRFLGYLALLAVAVASQVVLMAPLWTTVSSDALERRDPLFDLLPRSATLVNSIAHPVFGPAPIQLDPATSDLATTTRDFLTFLPPHAAICRGRRLELNPSPEGLDSFYAELVADLMPRLDDAGRVNMLEALGVERLILHRPLVGVDGDDVELLAKRPTAFGFDLRLYALRASVPEVVAVGEIVRAAAFGQALETLAAPHFDPRRAAVLPGDGQRTLGRPGTVTILDARPERLTLEVEAPNPVIVKVRRSWLPIWRATIDGAPVATTIVDASRLGVELPAGRHDVQLWVDRRPVWFGAGLSFLAALGLALTVARAGGRSHR
ncbi:MAG: hypothetical protein AAGN46_05680 [Acidobacteriota bacterium]